MKIINNYRRKKLGNVKEEILYFTQSLDKLAKYLRSSPSIKACVAQTYGRTRLNELKQKESQLLNKLGIQNAN